MYNNPNIQYKAPSSSFRESRSKSIFLASMIGGAIVIAPFFTGRSFVFSVVFLAVSIVMTILWRNSPRPWVSLTSISAATPIAIAKQQFTCNLIFAIWFALFNIRYLFRLPRWLYIPSFLVILGIIASSLNWMSSDFLGSIMRQGAYALNFFLGPFLLLPVAYVRMQDSLDNDANLKGLLYFLIMPMTIVLILAKMFGSISNWWEASQHVSTLPAGFLQYQLGRVIINFTRTQIGFVLAALICASTAITVSQVKNKYRILAMACLAMNAFMLLATGSFGSAIACFLGLIAILHAQLRKVSIAKVFLSLIVIFTTLVLSYVFAPDSTKEYLDKRYEHRVVDANTDRLALWGRAVDAFFEHPEGVGLTLSVGRTLKTYIHNDYLTYTVSYGFFGGAAYLSLMVGLILSFLRARRGVGNDPAALAVYIAGLGVTVALAANSMTDHSNENRWYFNVIWSIIWYCYFCSKPVVKRSSLPGYGANGGECVEGTTPN